jgi:hypothetical protein
MLALVAMRFLVPACRALIVSLPDTKPAPFRSRPRGSREPLRTATNLAADPRALPASRLGAFSGIAFAIAITVLVLGLHLPGARTSGIGGKIRPGQELVEGCVIAESACPGVFRDVLASFGVM